MNVFAFVICYICLNTQVSQRVMGSNPSHVIYIFPPVQNLPTLLLYNRKLRWIYPKECNLSFASVNLLQRQYLHGKLLYKECSPGGENCDQTVQF